ncbi:succinate dehydrogenase cytochrome b subunit b558 family [Coraliomargarita sp. CAG:312]|nr:succinate dehydrogenase cytochrome b subunit b558 family [Coraliomargarita sp. CAG:312]
MGTIKKSILSSLVKKFVMAITGFVLASFLLVHMLGNLQTLEGGPHAINAYANFLQTLPWEFLWGFRCALAACFVLHFLMAYLLVVENNKARPQTYAVKKNLASTFASRTMIYTGTIVIAFGIIHILHYTMLKLNPEFKVLDWVATSGMYEGKTLHDVYAMMILGFSNTWVSLAYIFSMVVIGFHLSHGVSSMFQSVGFRDEKWRYRLNAIAVAYCVVIAAGFSINPAAVLISKYTPLEIMPVNEVVSQIEKQKAEGKSPIFVNYDFLKSDCTAAKK